MKEKNELGCCETMEKKLTELPETEVEKVVGGFGDFNVPANCPQCGIEGIRHWKCKRCGTLID